MAEVRHLPASKYALRPRQDNYAIDENDLSVCEDQQIGSGAFARVFLGELRGPKYERRQVSNSSTAQGIKVAVKQSLFDTEEARYETRQLRLPGDNCCEVQKFRTILLVSYRRHYASGGAVFRTLPQKPPAEANCGARNRIPHWTFFGLEKENHNQSKIPGPAIPSKSYLSTKHDRNLNLLRI